MLIFVYEFRCGGVGGSFIFAFSYEGMYEYAEFRSYRVKKSSYFFLGYDVLYIVLYAR